MQESSSSVWVCRGWLRSRTPFHSCTPPAQQSRSIITETQQGLCRSPLSLRSPLSVGGGQSCNTLTKQTLTAPAGTCGSANPGDGTDEGTDAGQVLVLLCCCLVGCLVAVVQGSLAAVRDGRPSLAEHRNLCVGHVPFGALPGLCCFSREAHLRLLLRSPYVKPGGQHHRRWATNTSEETQRGRW